MSLTRNLTKSEQKGFVVKQRLVHLRGTEACDEFCVGVGPVQMRITEKDGLVRVETYTLGTYRCRKFPIGKVVDALNTLFGNETAEAEEVENG